MVSIVHTDLPSEEAAKVLETYLETGETHGFKSMPISQALSSQYGGFWDVFFMGDAFSYSVTCRKYVELASDVWNVLLCQESVDPEAWNCGPGGLTPYANGTLEALYRAPEGDAEQISLVLDPSLLYVDYTRFSGDSDDYSPTKRTFQTNAIMEAISGFDRTKINMAEAMRERIAAFMPMESWTVLVERNSGEHYFYAVEQHTYGYKLGLSHRLTLSVFNRWCSHKHKYARGEYDTGDESS